MADLLRRGAICVERPLQNPEARESGPASLAELEVVDRLCRTLESRGDEGERAAAARSLGSQDPRWALGPLLRAAETGPERVRLAAIEALGELGDPGAIDALAGIVRGSLMGGSLLAHRAFDRDYWSVTIGYAVLVFGLLHAQLFWLYLSLLLATLFLLFKRQNHYQRVGRRMMLVRGAFEALARIVEQRPDPEYRDVLPELRAIGGDRGFDRRDREGARAAAERIEKLTADLKQLPLAARPPEPDAATLPRPAGD